jgi:hypothetical protein
MDTRRLPGTFHFENVVLINIMFDQIRKVVSLAAWTVKRGVACCVHSLGVSNLFL